MGKGPMHLCNRLLCTRRCANPKYTVKTTIFHRASVNKWSAARTWDQGAREQRAVHAPVRQQGADLGWRFVGLGQRPREQRFVHATCDAGGSDQCCSRPPPRQVTIEHSRESVSSVCLCGGLPFARRWSDHAECIVKTTIFDRASVNKSSAAHQLGQGPREQHAVHAPVR